MPLNFPTAPQERGRNALEVPAYEVNYGVVPNVQLHLVLPLTASFAPMGGPTNFGMGDTELGAKVRFVKETKRVPRLASSPSSSCPAATRTRASAWHNWYRMPLWLQKSWGPEDRQWTSYGGGGEW